ncbi:hypothetical protein QOZ80_8AG0633500 [Eleusine coracana subsp. coracana]|nr:hypothetical protein QOZ80_8AG0633500 [Eleusine coracana subsp. coracana]
MSSGNRREHASANPSSSGVAGGGECQAKEKRKPPFRPASDDTKPVLRDPISRSDPVEAEQAVLLPPPFPRADP